MNETMTAAAPTTAFDADVLVRMARDVNDQAFASVFAVRYRQMLDARVSRINRALLAEDVDDALDATLSLKVSSSTVGTRELADLALVIEDNVRRLDVRGARTEAARLPLVAARADQALAAYLSA
jgi:HPt (histidine-containing phosphotransfer) domain-containing protein